MNNKDIHKGHVIIPRENKDALLYAIKTANEVESVIVLNEEYKDDKSRFEIAFTSIMGAFYVGRIYEKVLIESQMQHTNFKDFG